jgi:hypothetical protein
MVYFKKQTLLFILAATISSLVIVSTAQESTSDISNLEGVQLQDNYFYFISDLSSTKKLKATVLKRHIYGISTGQPYDGVHNTEDGQILVKAGRHKTKQVADEFLAITATDNRPYGCYKGEADNVTPDELNFFVEVNIKIDGYGIIDHIAFAQGSTDINSNDWWIISHNCDWVATQHKHWVGYNYLCKTSENRTVELYWSPWSNVNSVVIRKVI